MTKLLGLCQKKQQESSSVGMSEMTHAVFMLRSTGVQRFVAKVALEYLQTAIFPVLVFLPPCWGRCHFSWAPPPPMEGISFSAAACWGTALFHWRGRAGKSVKVLGAYWHPLPKLTWRDSLSSPHDPSCEHEAKDIKGLLLRTRMRDHVEN